ncbi:MAG TPA: hypothetical protein VJ599_04710 [Nitrososphaeraceae archaeon]|nr:hypothetical protein [Nitrososphaeraceae archaeon]
MSEYVTLEISKLALRRLSGVKSTENKSKILEFVTVLKTERSL